MALQHYGGNNTKGLNRLNKMLNGHWDKTGTIRFKYYGEFDTMKHLHSDCKDDLIYVGNSNIDGSPIFVFYYDNIEPDVIRDFRELNIILRKIKIKYYAKKELTKKERSILSFFKFFMNAFDNYYVKGVTNYEVNEVSYNTL